jgi:hypothetical protein
MDVLLIMGISFLVMYLLGRGESFNTSDPHVKHLNVDVETDRAERELNKDERLR